jgi:hypothetical protein
VSDHASATVPDYTTTAMPAADARTTVSAFAGAVALPHIHSTLSTNANMPHTPDRVSTESLADSVSDTNPRVSDSSDSLPRAKRVARLPNTVMSKRAHSLSDRLCLPFSHGWMPLQPRGR